VRTFALLRLAAAIAVVATLGACADDHDELHAWMQEVRNSTQPIRTTVPEPKQFPPFRYAAEDATDPFSRKKLAAAFARLMESPRNGIAPDTKRAREILENFPLEQIRMVGHIRNARVNAALLQVEDVVYQAQVGNHAGQNYGRITSIQDNEVVLTELVLDAAGDWTRRESSLRLQETQQ
jgi:type IV pilus assembly protein PilP